MSARLSSGACARADTRDKREIEIVRAYADDERSNKIVRALVSLCTAGGRRLYEESERAKKYFALLSSSEYADWLVDCACDSARAHRLRTTTQSVANQLHIATRDSGGGGGDGGGDARALVDFFLFQRHRRPSTALARFR